MRIGVISKKETYWSTRMLLKAVEAAGHEAVYLRTPEIRLVVGEPPDALVGGRSVSDVDVFIPRIGRSMTGFGAMLLRHLGLMGLRTTLSDRALTAARNKFLALQALHEAGVPVPKTVLLASRPTAAETRDIVPYPAVLKILSGTQGIGVMRVKDLDETASIVDTLNLFGEVVLFQEYIPNPGIDLRAFVVGDEVIASMKRVAPVTEWRANIHLGAKGYKVDLGEETKAVAVRAAKALGLEVSGVDMIMSGGTPYVLEVNASPGFKGLLRATGVNAADAIVRYAAEKAGR